jgi:hypothetical protein
VIAIAKPSLKNMTLYYLAQKAVVYQKQLGRNAMAAFAYP